MSFPFLSRSTSNNTSLLLISPSLSLPLSLLTPLSTFPHCFSVCPPSFYLSLYLLYLFCCLILAFSAGFVGSVFRAMPGWLGRRNGRGGGT